MKAGVAKIIILSLAVKITNEDHHVSADPVLAIGDHLRILHVRL